MIVQQNSVCVWVLYVFFLFVCVYLFSCYDLLLILNIDSISIWIIRERERTIIEKVIKKRFEWFIHFIHSIFNWMCLRMRTPSVQLIDMKCDQSKIFNFKFMCFAFDWVIERLCDWTITDNFKWNLSFEWIKWNFSMILIGITVARRTMFQAVINNHFFFACM